MPRNKPSAVTTKQEYPTRVKGVVDLDIIDLFTSGVVDNTAERFLSDAAMLLKQRGADYDSEGGERSMGKTVTAFNAITGQSLSESEGWLFMEILKNVRQCTTDTYHKDSAEDGVSYSALKAEALAKGL